MLQLLNQSYEARFLGCQLLTSAVTIDVLSRIVRELPSTDTETGQSQPSSSTTTTTTKVNDCCTVLCCASGLIVTRRADAESDAANQHAHPAILRVTLNDILFCHVDKKKPDITVWVVRNSRTTERETANDDVTLNVHIYKCDSASDALGLFHVYNEMSQQAKQQRNNRRSVTAPAVTPSPSPDQPSQEQWNSIADGIENNHQNNGLVRRRDREIREAMLEELRDTLRLRHGFDSNDVSPKKPLKDVSNMCNNRQRKPAKMISNEVNNGETNDVVDHDLIITSPNVTPKAVFQFPRSMGDIMKRLVTKNKNNDVGVTKPDTLPNANVATVAQNERKPVLKKEKKKAPLHPHLTDFEPEPVRIPNRINNLIEPYFYLSSKSDNRSVTDLSNLGVNSPGLSLSWVHHKQVVQDINNGNSSSARNLPITKRMNSGVKKKINGQSPLRTTKSNNKKKFLTNGSEAIFNRSSSTTSNGSSSSESGPDSKLLRSVMKKPKQTNDRGGNSASANEGKKNVTFHAYATVQVLP